MITGQVITFGGLQTTQKFSKDFPKWKIEYKLDKILKKIASHEIEKNKL